MPTLKPQRALGAAAMLCLSALAAVAQQEPGPAPPAERPPTTKTETAPGPQTAPMPSPQKPSAAPPLETPAGDELVGLGVFSSDGRRVGDVRSVTRGPSGNIAALHVRTGGFLGFGGRVVAIPEGRFGKSGQNIRLTLSAAEVGGLPGVKDGK